MTVPGHGSFLYENAVLMSGVGACTDDRSEIGGARQGDIDQCLLVRVEYALYALHARCSGRAVESKAVACSRRTKRAAQTATEAVGGEKLAGVVALKYVADGCNGGLIPAP